MKNLKSEYLIIGNSAAAVSAVEGIRSLDAKGTITVVSRERFHTYSRPLISYLLAGKIDETGMYYRPSDFYSANRTQAMLGVEATQVHTGEKSVGFADGSRMGYDRLLLACGGRSSSPDIPGLEARGVFSFTSWDDARALENTVHEKLSQRVRVKAVIMGSGLIGIKCAEALHAMGVEVLIVELAERVLPLVLDEHGSALAAQALKEAGIDVVCGTSVKSILEDKGEVCGVTLESGSKELCDMVITAIGVRPDVSTVRDTDIEVDRGIVIDNRCMTSVKDIFAAGDVAQGKDMLQDCRRPIPILPSATRQGKVAGINMAGGDAVVMENFAMNAVEVFGLQTVSMGLSSPGEDCEVLERKGPGPVYRRILVRGNRVMGALLIGDIDRAGIINGLIRKEVDVSAIKDLLLNDEFSLISLPTEYRKHVVKGEGIEV